MIRDIRKLLKSVPFKTFVIQLSDGQGIAVTEPSAVAVSPTGDRLTVFSTDGDFYLLNVAHVTELRVS